MRAKRNIDSEFVYQLLHSDHFVRKVLEKCTGTSYPAVNSSDLGSIKISLPPLPEQRRIATFLRALDARIGLVERQLAGAETFKRGLLQGMFV